MANAKPGGQPSHSPMLLEESFTSIRSRTRAGFPALDTVNATIGQMPIFRQQVAPLRRRALKHNANISKALVVGPRRRTLAYPMLLQAQRQLAESSEDKTDDSRP